jgi:Tfp pilus assembly protein PilO
MKSAVINRKIIVLFLILIMPFLFAFYPQEAKVNQKKIEREHKRKNKKAEKEYRQAKKNHQKKQSKETQSMMKKSLKQSKKNTPMKPPGGKKCK